MAEIRESSWPAHIRDYVAKQFPAYHFVVSKNMALDRYELSVVQPFAPAFVCMLPVPEKYINDNGEALRTFMVKLALVCG